MLFSVFAMGFCAGMCVAAILEGYRTAALVNLGMVAINGLFVFGTL